MCISFIFILITNCANEIIINQCGNIKHCCLPSCTALHHKYMFQVACGAVTLWEMHASHVVFCIQHTKLYMKGDRDVHIFRPAR